MVVFVLMLNDGVLGLYSTLRRAHAAEKKDRAKRLHPPHALYYRVYEYTLDAEPRL
jgi:hypothetical protein